MSSRNVAVRKDVYDALVREKRVGESFTHVILRLLAERGPLEELFGVWGTARHQGDARLLDLFRGRFKAVRSSK
jgi:predicted CopG family antitoxin